MLVPKHSMVVPMTFVLFVDLPIGELPLALYRLSMTRHIRVLGDGSAAGLGEAMVWLLALTALWATIGLLRLRRFE
jgi:hypothetical protein